MGSEEKCGSVDLLRGRLIWGSNDPYWFKILMAIIMALFLLTTAWLLKVWILPSIAGEKLLDFKFSHIIKGRFPIEAYA